MMKNKRLARSIAGVSWSSFLRILEYKCNWNGVKFIRVNRFFPSSKTCSNCGVKKDELKLSERTFSCESCGMELDRDLNAAINIRNEGLKIPRLPMEDSDNGQSYEVGSNI